MKQKIIVLIAASAIGGFIFWNYSQKAAQIEVETTQNEVEELMVETEEGEEATIMAQQEEMIDPETVATVELLAQTAGQTAYELLAENHQLEAKEYDFGVFIESIDGIKGDDKYYWAFYLNGEYAEKGADQTVLNEGDRVEFRYEQVEY